MCRSIYRCYTLRDIATATQTIATRAFIPVTVHAYTVLDSHFTTILRM